MKRIPRKWEFIAEKLDELNAPLEFIEKAKTIDKVCAEIYGEDTHTTEWFDYIQIHLKRKCSYTKLYTILKSRRFCIACKVNPCWSCGLAKKVKGCYDHSGEYAQVWEFVMSNIRLYEYETRMPSLP